VTETAGQPPATAPPRSRRPWSLQRRLILAVTGIVALILVIVGLATGALLGGILQRNLDTQIATSLGQLRGAPDDSAADILSYGRQERGTLVVLRSPVGSLSGAYVADDDTVETLHERIKVAERRLLVETVGQMARSGFTIENRLVRLGRQ
jgi:hypothetical protein